MTKQPTETPPACPCRYEEGHCVYCGAEAPTTRTPALDAGEGVEAKHCEGHARLQAAKERLQRCRDEMTFAIEQIIDSQLELATLPTPPEPRTPALDAGDGVEVDPETVIEIETIIRRAMQEEFLHGNDWADRRVKERYNEATKARIAIFRALATLPTPTMTRKCENPRCDSFGCAKHDEPRPEAEGLAEELERLSKVLTLHAEYQPVAQEGRPSDGKLAQVWSNQRPFIELTPSSDPRYASEAAELIAKLLNNLPAILAALRRTPEQPVAGELLREAGKQLLERLGPGEFYAQGDDFDLIFRPGGGSFAGLDQVVARMACGDAAYWLPGLAARLLNAALSAKGDEA